MKYFALSAILLFAVLPAFADSFNVFVEQTPPPCLPFNPGPCLPFNMVLMHPNGNPLLTETFQLPIDVLQFDIVVPPAPTFTFGASLSIGGQVTIFPVNTFPNLCPPGSVNCGIGIGFSMSSFRAPVDGVFAATLNGETETFKFQYVTTTSPEPTALILFATGSAAIGWRKYRQKRIV